MINCRSIVLLVVLAALWVGLADAQTTTPPGIDVEVFNPVDGSNSFCVAPSQSFWAHVFVRPGLEVLSCTHSCSPPDVAGGSANLATGVIDLSFATSMLHFSQAETNPDPGHAAVDGLVIDNHTAEGRIGWALAGDWNINGDITSGLKSPCDQLKIQSEAWVFRVQFTAQTEGISAIHIRRQADDMPFQLSFADSCQSPAFTLGNGGIDEAVDGMVLVSTSCAALLFSDGFESGDTSAWTAHQ